MYPVDEILVRETNRGTDGERGIGIPATNVYYFSILWVSRDQESCKNIREAVNEGK